MFSILTEGLRFRTDEVYVAWRADNWMNSSQAS